MSDPIKMTDPQKEISLEQQLRDVNFTRAVGVLQDIEELKPATVALWFALRDCISELKSTDLELRDLKKAIAYHHQNLPWLVRKSEEVYWWCYRLRSLFL